MKKYTGKNRHKKRAKSRVTKTVDLSLAIPGAQTNVTWTRRIALKITLVSLFGITLVAISIHLRIDIADHFQGDHIQGSKNRYVQNSTEKDINYSEGDINNYGVDVQQFLAWAAEGYMQAGAVQSEKHDSATLNPFIVKSPQRLQPSWEAKEMAKLIGEDAEPFLLGLKAMVNGHYGQADGLFDEADKCLNNLSEGNYRSQLQVNLFAARMQNASYAGKPQEAQQWAIKLEASAGEDPDLLSSVARIYYDNGDYYAAASLFRRAQDIREKTFGSASPDLALSLNDLGEVYCTLGRYTDAETVLTRALHIWEDRLGPEHIELAACFNNFGRLYLVQDRYDEARPFFERALNIMKNILGPDNPEVGLTLTNLGSLHRKRGQYVEAESFLNQALRICEDALGSNHPEVGLIRLELGAARLKQGDYVQAKEFLDSAIGILRGSLGDDHPNVSTGLSYVGELLMRQNMYSDAESALKEAYSINEKAFGHSHREVAVALNNLGALYCEQGFYVQAEPPLNDARDICEKLASQTSTQADVLQNLGLLYYRRGRYCEAESLLDQALKIQEDLHDSDHYEVINCRRYIAEVHKAKLRFSNSTDRLRAWLRTDDAAPDKGR